MRTHLLAAVATAAVLLAVTACSSDSDAEEPPVPPAASRTADTSPPEDDQATSEDIAALKEAVRAYVAAYYRPDVDAVYAMISTRCQKTETKAGFAELLKRARSGNVGHERYTLERFSVERTSGASAVVNHGVGDDPRYDLTQEWVREADGWRWDDCGPGAG